MLFFIFKELIKFEYFLFSNLKDLNLIKLIYLLKLLQNLNI